VVVDLVLQLELELDLNLYLNAQKGQFIHGELKVHSLKTGLVHPIFLKPTVTHIYRKDCI